MAGFVFHELSESTQARLAPVRAELAALRFQRAGLQLMFALKQNFNPDQPRVPAGQSGGGRWTNGAGVGDGLVRIAANGSGPLVPGGIYSVPVERNPFDPAGLNAKMPPSLEGQEQIAAVVNVIRSAPSEGLEALREHDYQNRPDPITGAALPPSTNGYNAYDVGPKSGKRRLLVDRATGQMYYTNNHYKSFWPLVPLDK
jgi:hypothetical protein